MVADVIDRALPSTRQRLFILAVFLPIAALSVQYTIKAGQHGKGALDRWREQIKELEEVDIYKQFAYPNPPIMAMILEPFVLLPSPFGALCWFYAKVAMTLLAILWTFALVETPDRPFPSWAKAVTVLLSLRLIMSDLYHGNVNLFILFLVVGCLYAFRRGRDGLSGVVLGLAISCKVTPALFLPYFVWKRAWKAAAGCVVGLVLFLVLIPGLRLGLNREVGLRKGMETNLRNLRSWAEVMVYPYVIGGQVTTEHHNQSLPGLAFRLATHSPSFTHWDGERKRYVADHYDNVVTLDPVVVRWLLKGCMALFAGLVVWSCRTPTAPRGGWRLAAEFSVVILGMLLFSERTWKHHCVVLLVPLAVILYVVAACRPGRGLRWYLVGSVGVAALLMASTSTGTVAATRLDPTGRVADSPELWHDPAKLAQSYGAFVWAYLLLLTALVGVLRHKEPSQAVAVPLPAAA